MKMRTIQQMIIGGCVWAIMQLLPAQAALAMQSQQDETKASAAAPVFAEASVKPAAPHPESISTRKEISLVRPTDKVPVVNLKKIEADKITSFFVRANDSKRIQLSMLVAYKPELTEAVRQMFGQTVTPLVFSVSTLPNRAVEFDPAKLRFEQGGRIWQPEVSKNTVSILPLDENAKFGGMVTDSQVHQGIVLLPAWIDPQQPITLRYGDFHYLAKFADLQKQ
ncbi:MAG: hypothetical protein ONB44_03720 [candidate division KSB1 bacterium]|nr:hypothetical protein [candidate division KSB1 bacterium]MDZ7301237.1 hypothetical protein [candidate division KSB1 bacterium]MDZ7310539.1 hypothetical protein [candidate division KSB1 bacterium]